MLHAAPDNSGRCRRRGPDQSQTDADGETPVRAIVLAAERLDHGAGAVDADRRDENWEVDTGAAERRELLSAACQMPGQTHGIKNPVAERWSAHALLHLIGLGAEPARAE